MPTTCIALLRAVNLGGTSRVVMSELRALCAAAGLGDVRTYIASGNVVCRSARDERGVAEAIAVPLAAHMGQSVEVHVRSASAMRAVLDANPFVDADPARTLVFFLDDAPPPDAAEAARLRTTERIALGTRELYVHHPDGIGRSRIVIPAIGRGTGRNVRTVAALVAMAEA
jgi:uncharacterized protein (DUF1697 family)